MSRDNNWQNIALLAVAIVLLMALYALVWPRMEPEILNECQGTTIEKGHSCACIYDHSGELGCLHYEFLTDDAKALKEHQLQTQKTI